MSDNKYLQEILNSYKWIKVKKFDAEAKSTDEYQHIYEGLLEHHQKETEFLIKKCRELAQELLDERGMDESSKIIKVYNKKDAPRGSIFLSERIERNGIVDICVRSLGILGPNERVVYLFQTPKK